MSYTAIQDTPITINLLTECNTTGWTQDGTVATHSSCNVGLTTLLTYPVTAGISYQVSYVVLSISGGNVQPRSPGFSGVARTAAGLYVETLTPTANGLITFYSNANCQITGFNVQPLVTTPGTTLVYSAKNNKWSDFRTFYPDFGWSIYTRTIVGNKGALYNSDNGGGNANNFFGVQYQSIFKLVENKTPGLLKSYNSIALQSNELLVTTVDGIVSSLGQVSDLIDQDFIKSVLTDSVTSVNVSSVEGIFSASFLKDKLSEGGLINGNSLRGNYITITLTTINGNVPLRLFSVAVNASQLHIGVR